jgi:hypothetical protein
LELIALLIEEAMTDKEALDLRWRLPGAIPFAQAYAKEGRLLLTREWTTDTVLSRAGDVIIIDTEDGLPPRAATERERPVELFRSIARYPELLSFLPARPQDAITCPTCSGTGVVAAKFAKPEHRPLVCECGGAGWKVAEGAEAK